MARMAIVQASRGLLGQCTNPTLATQGCYSGNPSHAYTKGHWPDAAAVCRAVSPSHEARSMRVPLSSSAFRHAALPRSAAMTRAVMPVACAAWLALAPRPKRSSTTSTWPCAAARIRGVALLLPMASCSKNTSNAVNRRVQTCALYNRPECLKRHARMHAARIMRVWGLTTSAP